MKLDSHKLKNKFIKSLKSQNQTKKRSFSPLLN